jgi:hypothetical protein
MAWPFDFISPWLYRRFGSAVREHFVTAELVLPWIVYIAHLIFSLCARKRQTFLILMWILCVVVLFNLGSCAYLLNETSGTDSN